MITAKTSHPIRRWLALAPLIALGLALTLTLPACAFWAVKDQQDQMLANMARQQEEIKVKQAAQVKSSFQQYYDAQEPSYEMMRSKLELYESRYQDWLKGVTSSQKRTNEFAATTKTHDEIKTRVDKLEDEHGALVQWYEKTKETPTNDDAMKLGQSFGSFGQKQQLYYSNYVDLNTRTMSISARNK